ncbi:UNVERIFIED_CONTAM: protein SMAX1-LIKE 6 [Sesamum radiatum]|uniref:Protein SMAX1-LIKE 6 n=1 Tax=Sesamum radiatum TaxID=300843 RepID=A0AAW2UQS1_SESRA
MPTPVGVARQCLAAGAAAVLDDAVAVAKRRGHAQTTSLHTVSALLALPASTLREACTRARSSAYSPRLQFRALELCVGVALDRVPVSKSAGDEPPVSNSLMAAIKRSQANQRRHPETFHLYQQQLSSNSQNCPPISAVKVELKHFIISILDDPIVSRVFGDAGFRTQEIKLAILNPLSMSRFSSTASRPPPLFPYSLSDLELNKRGPNFRFAEAAATENTDDNSRRIGEILLKRSRRNPLLIGVCASDAHRNFLDCLKRSETGGLPKDIDGLSVVSVDHEISEFISGSMNEETMEMKFKQVDEMVEDCQGPGIIVNCGDLKAFVDAESVDSVNYVVSKLKTSLINSGGKLWLIVFLAGDDDYKKLLERIPSIGMDWDLHLLPITTSTGGKCFKSRNKFFHCPFLSVRGNYGNSTFTCAEFLVVEVEKVDIILLQLHITPCLMRSFVPFGGLFSLPSELESLSSSATPSLRLCNLCNEKYEKEVSAVLKGVSIDSVADKKLVNLSSRLQSTECETSRKSGTVEAKEDKTILDSRVMALRRKWNDICQGLHCSWTSEQDISPAKSHTSSVPSLQSVPTWKDTAVMGSFLNENRVTNLSPCTSSELENNSLSRQNIPKPVLLSAGLTAVAERPVQSFELNDLGYPSASQQTMSPSIACTSPLSISVATDLRLGTLYDSAEECRRKTNLPEYDNGIQNFEPSRSHEKSASQVSQSSSCCHQLEKQMYMKDLEHPWKVLAEKFYWQMEAIQTISRTLSRVRNENRSYYCSNRGNVWLSFLGPDKVGKRKIAAAVAEIVFGRKEHLLYLDLSSEHVVGPFDSIVDCYASKYCNMNAGRKMIVDYLAGELHKHPHSVVFLENVEKADILVRNSLSQAIKTGKFPDSYGRDININGNVFILASSVLKVSGDLLFGKLGSEFPEEKVLEAKNLQMQILVGSAVGIYSRNNSTNVSVTPSKTDPGHFPVNKRKWNNDEPSNTELSKRTCCLPSSIIDLNLPVEDMDDDSDIDIRDDNSDSSDNSEVWLEGLLEHLDENVVFKPYDFDSLTHKILKEIDAWLKKAVGDKILLEIDREVIVQILAAAWLTDQKDALEDWIEQVLCTSVKEAQEKCNVTSGCVLKLARCDGLATEAQAPGVCLPARISVD